MSQSMLQTSFEVSPTAQEADLFAEAEAAIRQIDAGRAPEVSDLLHAAFMDEGDDPLDRLAGLRRIHESTGGVELSVTVTRDGDVMSVYGMENVEVAAVGETLRRTCPSILPASFSYSYSDSKPQTDAFGGGIVMVTKEGVEVQNTAGLQTAFSQETRDGPLGELQREALRAYDGEHGDTALRIGDLGYEGVKRMAYDGMLGDGLALFILGEVSDAEDDAEEAARMMRSAAEQLEAVAEALDAVAERRARDGAR